MAAREVLRAQQVAGAGVAGAVGDDPTHRGEGLVGLSGCELSEPVEVLDIGIVWCQPPGIGRVGAGERRLSDVQVDQRGGLVEAWIGRPGIDQVSGQGARILGAVLQDRQRDPSGFESSVISSVREDFGGSCEIAAGEVLGGIGPGGRSALETAGLWDL